MTVGSFSTDSSRAALSIPSRSHAVATPVPVPSSRKMPAGFDAASVRNSGLRLGCHREAKVSGFAEDRLEAQSADGGWNDHSCDSPMTAIVEPGSPAEPTGILYSHPDGCDHSHSVVL